MYKENKDVLLVEKSTDLKNIVSVLFTNRALWYSKKKLEANVISDTTYVIEHINNENVKAYYRRAYSYKQFGQYKESLADLKKILELEPTNKDAIREEKEVKKLFEDELVKQYNKQNKAKKADENKPVVSNKVTEISSTDSTSNQKPKVQEIDTPTTSTHQQPAKPEPVKRAKVDDNTIENAVKIAAKEIGKDKVRIPSTSYAFEADINSLKKDSERLFDYVSNIPPSTYSKIYKNTDIQPDYLVLILEALNQFETDNDKILNILYHFSLAQNITMTMMFFNEKDRNLIEQLIEKASQSSIPNKEGMLKKARSMID